MRLWASRRREGEGPLDELEALLQRARPVPLTDQIRVTPKELFGLLDRVAAGASGSVRFYEAVGELKRLVEEARPVPLTGQVRIDRDEAARLVAELRASA